MKEENLIYYLVLWSFLAGLILLIAGVKGIFDRKKEKKLLLYIEGLLYTWGLGVSRENLMTDLYYNLPPGSLLSKLMNKAQKISQGPKDPLSQLAKAFPYVEKNLQEYPLCIFHQLILSSDRQIDKKLMGLMHEIKNLWIKESKAQKQYKRAGAIKGTAMIAVLTTLNLGIYFKWLEHISFEILIVVNALGLLVFAVLVLGKAKGIKIEDAEKLAFLQWQLELIYLSADNSVIDAICLSYDGAPELIKPRLKLLIESIKAGSKSVKPYNDMCQGSCFAEMYECMGVLYERRHETGYEAIDYHIQAVKNYIRSVYKENISLTEEKIKAATGAALRLYQCAGSVGLMINIITILLHFAGQAA